MPVCFNAALGPAAPFSAVYTVTTTDANGVTTTHPVTDFSQCDFVVLTGSDYVASNAWRELGDMSISDAQTVGVAVGVLWATAWAFKSIARALRSGANPESEL